MFCSLFYCCSSDVVLIFKYVPLVFMFLRQDVLVSSKAWLVFFVFMRSDWWYNGTDFHSINQFILTTV